MKARAHPLKKNIWKKLTEPKKLKKGTFPEYLRKLICTTESKSNKNVTLKTWGTCCLHRKPLKINKIVSKVNFVSHIMPKNIKSGHLCSQNAVVSAKDQGREFGFRKKVA